MGSSAVDRGVCIMPAMKHGVCIAGAEGSHQAAYMFAMLSCTWNM